MNGESAPVDVGETYEVTINAVGEKGDGIARVKGFVLFVPGVQKGEVVKIRVTKVLPKVGFAEVLEKLGAAVYEKKFETISKKSCIPKKRGRDSITKIPKILATTWKNETIVCGNPHL